MAATACILSTSTLPKNATKKSSSSNTGLIIGVIFGGVKQTQTRAATTTVSFHYDNENVVYQPNDSWDRNLPTRAIRTGTGPLKTILGNKPLATGTYGEVWCETYGGQQVANKRMKSRAPRQGQKFIDEIIQMSQLDSDYIVKFVGASWTKPIEIECVVEYMDLGDLRSYLVDRSPAQFTWDQKYQCILSIVRGLVYLHTYRPPIIHRDLKSRNVLLDSNKGTKLTDFGTSRIAEEDDLMTNGIGTYQWMAPEVIAGTGYSAPADIYSFGIILSEFCTHEVPYAGMRHPQTGKLLAQHFLLSEVREGRLYPSFDGENVPAWVRDVAMQCLQLHEADRPTALELSAILSRVKP
ncbi:kinase [Thraustotheca clavata]|uniref:Kinase n=1 Tax=Thraustotheca clavata TaxID=74557 RepID=A0A1V9ZQA2_9STRA|nr:kinase [Thraustotheca clavata]